MEKKRNIIFYFSDQQRADTITSQLTPNIYQLGMDGSHFTSAYTCQPVCGPARACLQTGKYASVNGSHINGVPLNPNIKPIAEHFNSAGYQTAYVGKWHLASDLLPHIGFHCESSSIPKDRQGGYKDYFRGSDVLEFTSHGYDGYVFDGDGNKIDFLGYRADAINNFALDFLEERDTDTPFFLFVSQLEPHHQNDHKAYEGYKETIDNYKDYPIPADLDGFRGDYKESYPNYLSAINRLDYNVGQLISKLKQLGIYEDTIIIYTSDHGCHFKTRNMEYKRSPHDNSTHIPLVIGGGGYNYNGNQDFLVSLIDLPPTLLDMAGIPIPKDYQGTSILKFLADENIRDEVLIEISESHIGRAIRTKDYLYEIRGLASPISKKVKFWKESVLYDNVKDPIQRNNVIKNKEYAIVKKALKERLKQLMLANGEKPIIF